MEVDPVVPAGTSTTTLAPPRKTTILTQPTTSASTTTVAPTKEPSKRKFKQTATTPRTDPDLAIIENTFWIHHKPSSTVSQDDIWTEIWRLLKKNRDLANY